MIDRRSIRLTDPAALDLIAAALDAALAAVDPEEAVVRGLAEIEVEAPETVLALGKAGPAMTRGALRSLGGASTVVVVSDHPEPLPAGELLIGSHPVPDEASVAAGRALLDAAAHEGNILFLVSGGGSALAEVPADGLTLTDVATVYRLMLAHSVPIEDANTVRIHLSALKGGRLAAAAPGLVTTLAISDVGPKPELIASGPTTSSGTVPEDALAVLERHRLVDVVPEAVISHLQSAAPPPPVVGALLVVADGAMAVEAAASEIRRRGVSARVVTTQLSGDARERAAWLARAPDPGEVVLAAGETTVEVRGPGLGGRNQEAALAAALAIEGTDLVFAAFGTDGVDGPTDAAGAVVDGETAGRIRASGVDPRVALDTSDSHTALAAGGALIRTGPTGTNVADLWMTVSPPG